MTTLSQHPYFDSFDKNDNYVHVAFRAGRPVQARELNEIQSVLSSQVGAVSSHIFKNGTKVSGANITLSATEFFRTKTALDDSVVTVASAAGIKGRIVHRIAATTTEPAIYYIVYSVGSADGTREVFLADEEIIGYDSADTQIGTYEIASYYPNLGDDYQFPQVGCGVLATVTEGSFYINGRFVFTDGFTAPAMKWNKTSSINFGLYIKEEIVTSDDDAVLLDNATGFPNETAPGADRVKLDISAMTIPYPADIDESSFILLATYRNGELIYLLENTEYADLMDTIARRTMDESGHYSVNGLGISFREHLKDDDHPTGVFESPVGDETKFVSVISSGKAYVSGYEVKTIADTYVEHDKARDTVVFTNQAVNVPEHQYLLARYHQVNSPLLPGSILNDNPLLAPVCPIFSVAAVQIGYCRISNVLPQNPVESHNINSIYKVYFTDFTLFDGYTLADVHDLTLTTGSQTFTMFFEPTSLIGRAELFNPAADRLVFDVGYDYSISMMPGNVSQMEMIYSIQVIGQIDVNGRAVFTAGTNKYFLPKGGNYRGYVLDSPTSAGTMLNIPENVPGPISAQVDGSQVATVTVDPALAGFYIAIVLRVLHTGVTPITKTLTNTTQNFSTAGYVQGVSYFTLNNADLIRINSVKTFTNPAELEENKIDITSMFDVDYGQYPAILKKGKLWFTGNMADLGAYIDVDYDYFSNPPNVPFQFATIDSYRAAIDSPSVDFNYDDIRDVVYDGTSVNLANVIDIRPIEHGSEISPAVPVSTPFTITFDVEKYVKRRDAVVVDKNGSFYAVRGVPATDPKTPTIPQDALKLYDVLIDEYTASMNNVYSKLNQSRRYTMSDIRRLENRIDALEYYTSLSLLEQRTIDMDIRDSAGNQRYKNGFMVDSFDRFQSADINNPEYRASNDSQNRELKPSFKMRSLSLAINAAASTSPHADSTYSYFIPNYTEEAYSKQPYATKSLSINPFYIFAHRGRLIMNPDVDVWTDTDYEPAVVIDIDAASDAIRELADKTGLLDTQWGAWSFSNETTVLSEKYQTGRELGSKYGAHTVTKQTVTYGKRTGSYLSIQDRVDTYSVDAVVDVKPVTYIRPRNVLIVATRMKPYLQLNAFFDKENVTKYCRPVFGTEGEPLVTNENGDFIGWFRIPPHKFFIGEKTFVMTPALTLENINDFSSYAECKYFSNGIQQTKKETQFNIASPVLTSHTVTQETGPSYFAPVTTVTPWDPLAQSFLVDADSYITSVDLYFAAKDSQSNAIWVELREMENGVPVSNAIARVDVNMASITASNDSSVVTNVKFIHPVFVNANKFYAIVVGGSSPDTRLWVSELGANDVSTGRVVESNPSIGTLFKSQNGSTWTAEQREDVKMTVYRAKFASETTTIVYNEPSSLDQFKLKATAVKTVSGTDEVQIFCNDHGLVVGDYVSILQNSRMHISTTIVPQVGQVVTTANGQFTIASVEKTDTADDYIVTTNSIEAYCVNGACSLQPYSGSVYNPTLVQKFTGRGIPTKILPLSTAGTISQIETVSQSINGISAASIFDVLAVYKVYDNNTFSVLTGNNATATAKINKDFTVVSNLTFDVMNFSVDTSGAGMSVVHEFTGRHKGDYSASQIDRVIQESGDTFVDKTHVVISPNNSGKIPVGEHSVKLVSTYVAPSLYVAPIINLDSASIVMVANRVGNSVDSGDSFSLYVPETDPAAGTAAYKYVSNTMQMTQTAYDVMVVIDVYRPRDSTIDFYYKTKQTSESGSIEEKDWVWIDGVEMDFYSSNVNDVREVKFVLSELVPTEVNGSSFNDTDGFDFLKLKIVCDSDNPSNPPILKNLRLIAIT